MDHAAKLGSAVAFGNQQSEYQIQPKCKGFFNLHFKEFLQNDYDHIKHLKARKTDGFNIHIRGTLDHKPF